MMVFYTNLIITFLLSIVYFPRSIALTTTATNDATKTTASPSSSSGASIKYQNNLVDDNDKYPHCFSGRLWVRPALVRAPDTSNEDDDRLSPPPSSGVNIVSLFGWTLGGVVALEYDDSPVGPYREYVTLGATVTKRGTVGQWGSRLFVSTKEAESICSEIWNVPAEVANIDFLEEESTSLCVSCPPALTSRTSSEGDDNKQPRIVVNGWKRTRVIEDDDKSNKPPQRQGNIPVLWTPTIKALWAPVIPVPKFLHDILNNNNNQDDELPLHRLRLSASAARVVLCGQKPSDLLGINIGLGLVVDNVLIEISNRNGEL